jgi:Holliday junction resolvase
MSSSGESSVMKKSTRHSKIIGDFGEFFVCDSLSKSGFEVLRVDHTGLDVIAYNTSNQRRLGITVKSRTRKEGKENDAVNIFSHQKGKDDRQKLLTACEAFGCEPWIAVYVETLDDADLYLTSLENYDNKYRGGKAIEKWKMNENSRKRYAEDPDVKHIRIQLETKKWKFSN